VVLSHEITRWKRPWQLADGTSWLLSRGTLNLNHIPSSNHTAVRAITPGSPLVVEMDLAALAVCVPAGSRLRLALSPCNWPLVWPTGAPAELCLLPGGTLRLPLTHSTATYDWQPAPHFHDPLIGPVCPTEEIRPAHRTTHTVKQLPCGAQVLQIVERGGLTKLIPRGISFGEDTVSTYTLRPGCTDMASIVIDRKYETSYDIPDGPGVTKVWRTVVRTTSEMHDVAAGAGIRLRHRLHVSDACCAGSARSDDSLLLSAVWEGSWDGTAPTVQAQLLMADGGSGRIRAAL
jgi:hypothetical protein